MFYPTCFIFRLLAVGVSPVVSHSKLLACCSEPTRWCRAVYIALAVCSLFPCLLIFFFFSSSLYFCSQIIASLLPRGRLVPPCATKLRVPHRPYFKFARKLRVLVALLKGQQSCCEPHTGCLLCASQKHKHMNYLFYEAQFCLYRLTLGFPGRLGEKKKNRRSHSHEIGRIKKVIKRLMLTKLEKV